VRSRSGSLTKRLVTLSNWERCWVPVPSIGTVLVLRRASGQPSKKVGQYNQQLVGCGNCSRHLTSGLVVHHLEIGGLKSLEQRAPLRTDRSSTTRLRCGSISGDTALGLMEAIVGQFGCSPPSSASSLWSDWWTASFSINFAAFFANSLLTSKEATQCLGVSLSWLAKSRMRGDGPAFIKVGRNVRYMQADIARWIKSRQRLSTSEQ
jgi:predicted DNA-binding transcriptional regulator AlpA